MDTLGQPLWLRHQAGQVETQSWPLLPGRDANPALHFQVAPAQSCALHVGRASSVSTQPSPSLCLLEYLTLRIWYKTHPHGLFFPTFISVSLRYLLCQTPLDTCQVSMCPSCPRGLHILWPTLKGFKLCVTLCPAQFPLPLLPKLESFLCSLSPETHRTI